MKLTSVLAEHFASVALLVMVVLSVVFLHTESLQWYAIVAVVSAMLIGIQIPSLQKPLHMTAAATLLGLILSRSYVEHYKGKKGKKSKKREKMTNEDSDEESNDEESDEKPSKSVKDPHMDLGTTWMNAYNKLSPEVVHSMRTDTKELMSTQKELMESLAVMGPAVQDGMQLLNSFKTYFGDVDIAPKGSSQ